MEKQPLYLYEAKSAAQVGPVESTGLDVFFPEHVAGWTDVLDCREEPYTEKSIAENCAFAMRVHKKFILVGASQIAHESPAI